MLSRWTIALQPTARCSAFNSNSIRNGTISAYSWAAIRSRNLHAGRTNLDEAPRKKRPSPYRLLQPHTFLAAFAPLHVAGWRLDALPSASLPPSSQQSPNLRLDEGMDDLQERRLIRTYQFPEGQEGWQDLIETVGSIGKMVEQEDHHPTILICPAADYSHPTSNTASAGYVLEVSTHTHTPMPPLRTSIPSSGEALSAPGKVRPGVTGKDTKLAERIEELYRDKTAGVPA